MSILYPHAFYWGWTSTLARSWYWPRYRYWAYQKMVVCDTIASHPVWTNIAQTWLLPSQNVRKKKVARERFVSGFRLYQICQYLAFYAFFFFHRSNQWRHFRFPRCSCCIQRVWLVSSFLQGFIGQHVCFLVSKLLAHDSIFKQLFSPSHIDKSKAKLQIDTHTYTHSVCTYTWVQIYTH